MFKYTQGDAAGTFPTVKSDLGKVSKDDLVEMVRTLQEDNCDLRGSEWYVAQFVDIDAANAANVSLLLRRDKEITDLKAHGDSLLRVHLHLRHDKDINELKAQVARAENESLLLRRDKKITELKAQVEQLRLSVLAFDDDGEMMRR
jgi:hypothetical protein